MFHARPAVTHRLLAVGLAAAATLAAAPLAAAEDLTTDPTVGTITGLATDAGNARYWAVGAKGTPVRALGADGKLLGEVSFAASPQDVQSVQFRNGRVWVGDIGDTSASRTSVTVYRFGDLALGSKVQYRSYSLAYPDGPQDSQAMVVSPKGRIYVITRGERPGIHRAPAEPVPGGVVNKLDRVGEAPANVTDAAFTADGTKLVLRTLTSLHVLDPYTFEETASAVLPATAQGGGLTPSTTGSTMLVSSLATPASLTKVPLPTSLASVPPAPATPSNSTPAASASASPSAAATSTSTTGGSDAARNRGSLWALAAAGAISLAAGAFVLLKR